MLPKLIEPGGEGAREREILIQGQEFLIGRGSDCNLRLAVSAISRHHCLLRIRAGEATLSDLGSSNGTFVNGKRVRSQVALHTGDEIRVGSCRFLVDLGDGVDLGTAPASDPAATTCKMPPAESKNRDAAPAKAKK
jgi:pSer/pThr/pTyr-binding forkhead associated (FHA) protein